METFIIQLLIVNVIKQFVYYIKSTMASVLLTCCIRSTVYFVPIYPICNFPNFYTNFPNYN